MTLSFAPEHIETWPLERLKPYARNAKTHGADQVAKIAGSMARFGWTVPVLVAGDGEVIAGHGRILAAAQLGLTEAPVIVLDHLTEEQRRAYRIADNKLTELGAWEGGFTAAPTVAPAPAGTGIALASWRELLDASQGNDFELALRATARPAVARVSTATAERLGLSEVVTVSDATDTLVLPLDIDPTMVDDVVWIPMNHRRDERLWAAPGASVTVDLVSRTVTAGDIVASFEVDDYTRWRLLEGLDDISLTLRHEQEITDFEAGRPSFKPTTASA